MFSTKQNHESPPFREQLIVYFHLKPISSSQKCQSIIGYVDLENVYCNLHAFTASIARLKRLLVLFSQKKKLHISDQPCESREIHVYPSAI